MATVIISAVVLGALALAFRSVIKSRKSGGCSGCPGCGGGLSGESKCGTMKKSRTK